MTTKKKRLSLVLALALVFSALGPVLAAKDPVEVPQLRSNSKKIQWLKDQSILIGRSVNEDPKNPDLALDKTITRAEVTKLLVYAGGKIDLAKKIHGLKDAFPDVQRDHWANGLVSLASGPFGKNGLPLAIGYPDGSFKPSGPVTYAELAKMLVVVTDPSLTPAQHDKANKAWPFAWMSRAEDLGLFDDLKGINPNDQAFREEAFVMVFNSSYHKYQNENPQDPDGESKKPTYPTGLLRVLTPPGKDSLALLENSQGQKYSLKLQDLPGTWPKNYKMDKYDLVSLSSQENGKHKLLLDHSDTENHPIVQLTAYNQATGGITLKDKNENSQTLSLAKGFDLFPAKAQLEGAVIQFSQDGQGKVNLISVLPGATQLAGNLAVQE
ncbi:MAG: S-layer homology domain-containing protein [Tissierellia bacterium]|nr:S-layer homology domain-containing protein [Tissierellia bacterium]